MRRTRSRRDFLKGIGLTAAGLAAATPASAGSPLVPPAKPGPVLPTVPFGKHRITRLIAGANTIYGYSHFNQLFSAHMVEYHSTERVLAFLAELERAGLNTWQASWSERLETDWLRYKDQGGKLQLLILSRPDFNDHPEILPRVARLQPLGIAQHGARTNRYWQAGQIDRSLDYLKRIQDTGVMVGLSCHSPRELEYVEDKAWPVDYYMTSLYYLTRSRQDFEKLLGEVPLGEIYLPSDPPRMLSTIRRVKKTCLAYKVFAAGRTVDSAAQVRERLAAALTGIKPTDAVILGMYQRYTDQIGHNAQLVREILKV
ncbi:MAG: twin-arginine translocation signal domain-containing protein [Acidobacteria bacterium]|nr:twin-arginine translocation signal domain-containing protein [Acidobacteriota bacterium]